MLADAVKHGYASVTTDLGSGRNQSARWMYGHPEYVKDWAYRGWHEATLKAKALMDMYYGGVAILLHGFLRRCGAVDPEGIQMFRMTTTPSPHRCTQHMPRGWALGRHAPYCSRETRQAISGTRSNSCIGR